MHAVLEALFDLPASERTPEKALELVEPRWLAMVEDEPELAEMLADGSVSDDAWFADAGRLVERWFELEDPSRLEPAEREMYVETEVALGDGTDPGAEAAEAESGHMEDGAQLTLRGYIDRLDVAPTGEIRIVDYKTGRCPDPRFEGKALFQMKFYALVIWRLRGVLPAMLQLVYLGDGKVLRYVPDEADLLGVERNVKAVWAAIERAALTGDWRPRTSSLCSWCDFKELCPEFGGTPPPLPADAATLALDPVLSRQVIPADD